MNSDGVKVLKLSASGVWEKKILCVSDECLVVSSDDGRMNVGAIPQALIWIKDDGRTSGSR